MRSFRNIILGIVCFSFTISAMAQTPKATTKPVVKKTVPKGPQKVAVNTKPAPTVVKENAVPAVTKVWDKTSHDFGTVKLGTVAKVIYTIKNTGTTDIKITEVQPACGCTKGEFTNTVVKPGESGIVTLIFNTEGRLGTHNKSATVTFEDGTTQILTFSINVVSEIPNTENPTLK